VKILRRDIGEKFCGENKVDQMFHCEHEPCKIVGGPKLSGIARHIYCRLIEGCGLGRIARSTKAQPFNSSLMSHKCLSPTETAGVGCVSFCDRPRD
jgi:hypothetical protein